jgi:4-hydroxybenzoate polyprenyltransferase
MRARTLSWPPALAWSRYLEVLKPRETALLTFIGAMAGLMAGTPSWDRLLLVAMAVGLGSAGVNGLTNYLDREVDARMERTRRRALPSQAIYPPEKVLPLCGGLVALALALAWYLHPWAFAAGLLGTATALVGRKRAFTHLLGGISGSAPVLVGWLGVNPQVTPLLGLLALLILAAILWFLGVPKVLAILTGLAGFAVFLIQQLQGLPKQNRTSLVLLLLAIFSWFVGFSAIEAFFTLYGRNVLGIRENLAAILFGISNVTFIIFAIPSGTTKREVLEQAQPTVILDRLTDLLHYVS